MLRKMTAPVDFLMSSLDRESVVMGLPHVLNVFSRLGMYCAVITAYTTAMTPARLYVTVILACDSVTFRHLG
jgi:hypothetical protein